MMFDEKKMRQMMRQPRKQKMDAIDQQAEAEGKARRFFREQEVEPSTLGRRISKTNRQFEGNRKTADVRADRNQQRVVDSYVEGVE